MILKVYKEYKQMVEIASDDAVEKSVASMRELVAGTVLGTIAKRLPEQNKTAANGELSQIENTQTGRNIRENRG